MRGISRKMLSQLRKGPTRDGIVTGTVSPTLPVTVEQALTRLPFGRLRAAARGGAIGAARRIGAAPEALQAMVRPTSTLPRVALE